MQVDNSDTIQRRPRSPPIISSINNDEMNKKRSTVVTYLQRRRLLHKFRSRSRITRRSHVCFIAFIIIWNTFRTSFHLQGLYVENDANMIGGDHEIRYATVFEEIEHYFPPLSQKDFIRQHPAEDRFLLYYSHSGMTNQLVGLEAAAYFAFATHRTLVLPPVLPHHTAYQHDDAFSEFEPRAAGSKCAPYDFYEDYIDAVKTDVRKASDPEIKFPSFVELFDFDDLSQKTGLKVIDMRDFAKDPKNIDPTLWCTGEVNRIQTKMTPRCLSTNKTSFSDLVPQFQDVCGSDQRVAVIGSAFVMPYPEWLESKMVFFHEKPGFKELLYPSPKFLSVVKKIHSHLPLNYTGVHIRFKDNLEVDACDEVVVKETYNRVFDKLKQQNVPPNGYVLIGNGNEASLKCFKHHAKGSYNVSTVQDIIDSDEAIKLDVDEIEAENGTLLILLDQILIAMGDTIVLQKMGTTANTFQFRITQLHEMRDSLRLNYIEKT